MKVLLIAPTFHYATEYPAFLSFSDFPSGFGYLSAALKQAGHKVFGLNPNNITGYANAWLMIQDVISQKLREVQPGLIGLGGLCIDYRFLKDAIGIIRGFEPTIPIVLGGQIVTNDAEDVLKLLKPDYGISGEGEEAIVQLAHVLSEPGPIGTIQGIANLWYFNNGAPFTIREEHHYKPIDELPFPDYEPFGIDEMLDEYSVATRVLYRYSRPDARPFNIVASRGCPFSCSFCIDHHRGYRARTIPNIMSEIKVMFERYHFNVLIILDELFAVNKQRMIDFCAGILVGSEMFGWDFDWLFQTHANARLDKDSLRLAKQAGCCLFSYGLESASPVVLKSMNKRIKIEQVEEAIEMAEEVGLGFAANLIFGDIAETTETVAESLAFWFKYGIASDIFLGLVNPYPGSALFEACRKKGMWTDKREFYEHIDEKQFNMTTMSDKEFGAMVSLLGNLERAWLFVRRIPAMSCEVEKLDGKLKRYLGGEFYRITAECPYCGGEIAYRHLVKARPFWLGTGCTKCNRRIRVEVS